jgi:hypothetical protein
MARSIRSQEEERRRRWCKTRVGTWSHRSNLVKGHRARDGRRHTVGWHCTRMVVRYTKGAKGGTVMGSLGEAQKEQREQDGTQQSMNNGSIGRKRRKGNWRLGKDQVGRMLAFQTRQDLSIVESELTIPASYLCYLVPNQTLADGSRWRRQLPNIS